MHTRIYYAYSVPATTNLKPVCFISAGSCSTTAHFVVDAPSTGIVCLETLAAAVGWNMHSHNMYMHGTMEDRCTLNRVKPTCIPCSWFTAGHSQGTHISSKGNTNFWADKAEVCHCKCIKDGGVSNYSSCRYVLWLISSCCNVSYLAAHQWRYGSYQWCCTGTQCWELSPWHQLWSPSVLLCLQTDTGNSRLSAVGAILVRLSQSAAA